MKVDILGICMDAWDLRYANPEVTPTLYSIGEPYKIEVDCKLPCISGKAYYQFFTGKNKDINNLSQYFNLLKSEQGWFWKDMNDCRIGMLGFHASNNMTKDFNGIIFSAEPPGDENVIAYPKELYQVLKDDIDLIETKGAVLEWYLKRNWKEIGEERHRLHKMILQEEWNLDILLICYFEMDRISHRFYGPELTPYYKWQDNMMKDILDIVETDNVLVFSEHGSHHAEEALFCSNKNHKIKHFKEIIPLIKEIYKNERNK